jgi:MFS family permease
MSGELQDGPMHWRQVLAVVLCVALTGLDGFDVLAISFAAPGIAAEWGINRAMLGVVLSIELFGMAAGSALLGTIADRVGRKPTIVVCLCIMTGGMFAASMARSIPFLAGARLFTGLGIGGMLASSSAIVAEVSNSRRRNLNLSLNIAGYPGGAILGGTVASYLLARNNNWRAVFQFGAFATLVALPLALFLLQEPKGFLQARTRAPLKQLFSRELAPATLLLTGAYFAQIMVFYFVQKWIPKILVDMGHTPAEAGAVLVAANIGCLLGAVAIGVCSQLFRFVPLMLGAMVCAFCCVAAIGMASWNLQQMAVICFVAGLFVNAAVVGLYPVMAQTFPAQVRGSGIGFAIGVGRGGAALGPMAAGALFTLGYGLGLVSLVMGIGALIAAVFLILLVYPNRR